MNIEQLKKLIANTAPAHKKFLQKAELGQRYYFSQNDILFKKTTAEDPSNPRNSDHRIPSKFYQILVDQKASYIFDIPPFYDLGDEDLNQKVMDVLGNKYARTCKRLCIDACNCGVSWLQIWITGVAYDGEEDTERKFKYAVVDPKQVIPIWGNKQNEELIGLLHHYLYTDLDGKSYEVYDFWDKEFCYSYRTEKDQPISELVYFNRFYYYSTDTESWDTTNVYKHGFKRVPFICFKNNPYETNDLLGIKDRIDAYDEVQSQFANDLEDIQETIYILSGYGKEPEDNFLKKLKMHKFVKIESNYPNEGTQPSLDTLSIEIPVEARQLAMEDHRKAIFEQGAGVDSTPEALNYTSGEALKYRYQLLELKADITEDEFRNGFTILVKEICKFLGTNIDENKIEQRWQRSKINNDTELVNNARLCFGFTSLETALKVNPYVEDVDRELELIRQENEEAMEFQQSIYDVKDSASEGESSYWRDSKKQRDSEKKTNTPEKYTTGSKKVSESVNRPATQAS